MILALKIAWNSLFINKSRTFLTIFGIVIGIAAIIIVISAGESIKGLVLGQLESFGSNYIQIETKVPNTGKNSTANAGAMAQGVQITTLKNGDAEAIGKISNIKNYYAAVIGQSVVSYLDQNKTINFMGESAEAINIGTSEVATGRFYTDDEDRELAWVVVLGSNVAKNLFNDSDPVNQSIKLGHNKYTVVGVLKEQGAGFGLSFDDFIYMPLQTAQKLIMGIDHVMMITAQVKDASRQDETANEINSLLRERHKIYNPVDDDFSVTTLAEAKDMINTVFGGITLLLVAIAGISLVVGGIGIMNIMYVSVTERTFEIGLRKSIGAEPHQILWQFLWEAIMVTVFGGIIGVALGIGFTYLVSVVALALGFSWGFNLPVSAVIIAFGFSAIVGLVFGYYPAQRAAKMNPIEALRYDNS